MCAKADRRDAGKGRHNAGRVEIPTSQARLM
jgi:hypothetical protein